MEHVLVDQQMLLLEDGNELCLDYYLMEDMRENDVTVYGIKVEKRGEQSEVETTGPISYSKEWVTCLCKKIAGFQVTPLELIHIVDDIITES